MCVNLNFSHFRLHFVFILALVSCFPCVKVSAETAINITGAPYHAVGDGITDNTKAISQALSDAAAATPRRAVHIPAGIFAHSGEILDNGVALIGDGAVSILSATMPDHAAIHLTGFGAQFKNCSIIAPNAKTRLSTPWSAAVWVEGATNFLISGVAIGTRNFPGAASAGIICANKPSSHGAILNNTVSNTLADAIHITDGSSHILVNGNTITNVGDDMVAVVSYVNDGAKVHDIAITNNHCVSQTWGRGITVVGGENVKIAHNQIDSYAGSAIYLASEDSYKTYDVNNVAVTDNVITNTNSKAYMGCILMLGRADTINGARIVYLTQNITIERNTVNNGYFRGIKADAYTSNIKILNNTLTGTMGLGILINETVEKMPNTGTKDVTIRGNTIKSAQESGIVVLGGTRGIVTITDNTLIDVDTSKKEGLNVISIDPKATEIKSLTISGNKYFNPGHYPTGYYIDCGVSAASVGTSADAIKQSNTETAFNLIHVTP